MSAGQSQFGRALLDPHCMPPPGLTNPDGVPATKRFDIYRNNVTISLTDALHLAFPVLRKIVGTANFDILARAFLRAHPPLSPVLMQYGQEMPAFVQDFAPVRDLGYLPDVARLELALRQSYHAADSVPAEPAILQGMDPGDMLRLSLILAPSLRLIRSRWPVHAIWRYNVEAGTPKPQAAGQNVLITRPGFDPVPQVLPAGGGVFVEALQTGATLGTAIDAATARLPDFDPAPVLALLLDAAAIVGIDRGLAE